MDRESMAMQRLASLAEDEVPSRLGQGGVAPCQGPAGPSWTQHGMAYMA